MSPKPLTLAVRAQTPIEADLSLLNIGDNQEQKADVESTPSVPVKKKRRKIRKRTNRGLKPSRHATVEDTNDVAETRTVAEDFDGAGRSSSPSDRDTIATEPLPQFRFGRALPQAPGGTYIEIPILPHYELRQLPSVDDNGTKDDNDEGLFATQKIYAGARIISEQPLFTLPAPGDQVPQLMEAYENLPKSDQEAIWSLRPAAATASDALMTLRYLADTLAVDLNQIGSTPDTQRTPDQKAFMAEMMPKLRYAMDVYRVTARWHANRSSMLNIPVDERHKLPNGTPITGLFIERAHIRHSCVPNCWASYDAELGRMNVHVLRDVKPEEELTCSSFTANMYYSNAEDRKDELVNWGLTCSCEACDSEHPKYSTHETARTRANTRVVLLTDTLTRLESEQVTEAELDTAQNIVLELIGDLKTSGCESVETVRWRNILVDRILPARALVIPQPDALVAWQVILHHARESERIGRMCYGEDRGEFRVLRQTREGTEATITMIEEGIVAGETAGDSAGGRWG